MKKGKLILSVVTLLGLGGLALGAASMPAKTAKEADAVISAEHYVHVNTTNFWSGQYTIGDQIRNGNTPFIDQFYGTPRPLIDTATLNENSTGEIRSDDFNQTGEYVSFLIGGNPCGGRNFINLWSTDKSHNIEEGITNNAFNGTTMTHNMIFKYVRVPEEYRGKCLIYICDGVGNEEGPTYRGVTFGDLRINQTWDEVVESFSAHIAHYKLSCIHQNDINAYNAVKNFYDTDSYYAALRTSLAAKTSADDNFEKKNGLMNWALDRDQSRYPNNDLTTLDFENIISDVDLKQDDYFSVGMPSNKTDTYYVRAENAGIYEDAKYRLVSSEFTLSGSGFISAKLGGGTAVLQLLDENYNVLVSSATAEATGENKLRPGFQGEANQAETFNLADSGVRLNTMSRVFIDGSQYVGDRVRVALADARTGFGWGLAYFDDVKTYYPTTPSFNVDVAKQADHYLTIPDEYVGSGSTAFGKAHAFWRDYLDVVRGGKLGQNYCSILTSDEIKDLVDDYNELPAAAKTIVCGSVDFERVGTGTWYDINPTIYTPESQFNIARSIQYFGQANGISVNGSSLVNIIGAENSSSAFIVLIMFVALVSTSMVFILVIKKRKYNK